MSIVALIGSFVWVYLRVFNFCLLYLFIYFVLGYYIRCWNKAVYRITDQTSTCTSALERKGRNWPHLALIIRPNHNMEQTDRRTNAWSLLLRFPLWTGPCSVATGGRKWTANEKPRASNRKTLQQDFFKSADDNIFKLAHMSKYRTLSKQCTLFIFYSYLLLTNGYLVTFTASADIHHHHHHHHRLICLKNTK